MRGIIAWPQTTIRVRELEEDRLKVERVAEEDRAIAEMLAEESCLCMLNPIYGKLISISATKIRFRATGGSDIHSSQRNGDRCNAKLLVAFARQGSADTRLCAFELKTSPRNGPNRKSHCAG